MLPWDNVLALSSIKKVYMKLSRIKKMLPLDNVLALSSISTSNLQEALSNV